MTLVNEKQAVAQKAAQEKAEKRDDEDAAIGYAMQQSADGFPEEDGDGHD